MRSEFVKVKGRGVCILISDLSIKYLLRSLEIEEELESGSSYHSGVFNDVMIISELIRSGQKIPAIKEVRTQTSWGLKEAKQYIDKFLPMGLNELGAFDYNHAAQSFINANMPVIDYLTEDEMEIL